MLNTVIYTNNEHGSDHMTDCGVRSRGHLCLSRQLLSSTALGTACAPFLQCLGWHSLPPSVGR